MAEMPCLESCSGVRLVARSVQEGRYPQAGLRTQSLKGHGALHGAWHGSLKNILDYCKKRTYGAPSELEYRKSDESVMLNDRQLFEMEGWMRRGGA